MAPDEQSIRQVVAQAETSELTLPYPQIGALAADNAQVQDAQIRSSAILASFYAPSSPRLATREGQIRQALEAAWTGNSTVVQAGIRDLSFDSIAITGTTALAHLTFTAYSDFTARQADGRLAHASPSNRMIADVTLVKTDQGWRIEDEVARFAPGSEP